MERCEPRPRGDISHRGTNHPHRANTDPDHHPGEQYKISVCKENPPLLLLSDSFTNIDFYFPRGASHHTLVLRLINSNYNQRSLSSFPENNLFFSLEYLMGNIGDLQSLCDVLTIFPANPAQ